jgi:hypothetical protein
MKRSIALAAATLIAASDAAASQSLDDSISAGMFALEHVGIAQARIPAGTEVVCFRANGGRVWPDSVRGGESFEAAALPPHLYSLFADSLTRRFALPTVPHCEDSSAAFRVDSLGRQAALVGLSTPIFFSPDSAVVSTGFAGVTWESFGWTCRIRRSAGQWSIASPCFTSVVHR